MSKELQASINRGLFNMIRSGGEIIWDYSLNNEINELTKSSQSEKEQLQASINRGLFNMLRSGGEIIWDYCLDKKIDELVKSSQSEKEQLQASINRGLFNMIRSGGEIIWDYSLNKKIDELAKFSSDIQVSRPSRSELYDLKTLGLFMGVLGVGAVAIALTLNSATFGIPGLGLCAVGGAFIGYSLFFQGNNDNANVPSQSALQPS